jgi:hypothetical protein
MKLISSTKNNSVLSGELLEVTRLNPTLNIPDNNQCGLVGFCITGQKEN